MLLITIDQEWEVSYLPIQSKSGENIISTCLHFDVVQQPSSPILPYDTIYFHEHVFPEVPQLPSENRIVQNPPALRTTLAFLTKIEEATK